MIIGTTPSHTLTMRLAAPADRLPLCELIREWQAPYMQSMPDVEGATAMCQRKADQLIAANENYTDQVDENTGFDVTFVATVDGAVVGWERCQVTEQHSFVHRLAVFNEHQNKGYFTTLRECGEFLCFDHLGLLGVMWEIVSWATVMDAETAKHGYPVIETKKYDETIVDVVGYNADFYTQTMKPKQQSSPQLS